MKTSEFLLILENNKNKELLFEYAPSQFVASGYHITEVKNVTIESVDCGAGTDFWRETVVQLWESPSHNNQDNVPESSMSTLKALGILKKVGKINPYTLDAEIKFEYGNDTFHTAQLFIENVDLNFGKVSIKLSVNKTDCKAKETCGIKPILKIPQYEPETNCCTSDSGCC